MHEFNDNCCGNAFDGWYVDFSLVSSHYECGSFHLERFQMSLWPTLIICEELKGWKPALKTKPTEIKNHPTKMSIKRHKTGKSKHNNNDKVSLK